MIVSHTHRFIFIKNVKAAGTSIEVFLSQFCQDADIVTPIHPVVEPHRPRNSEGFYNHMPGAEIRERIGEDLWNSYYKFCVERNPWDKTLSYYYMEKYRSGGRLSLDEVLNGNTFPVNYPRYTEPDNPQRILVDRIIDFEALNDGLADVFESLGIPFSGYLDVFAKSEYRSDRRPYQQVLNPIQAQRISDLFRVEIEMHGYRFNGLW
ncbi:MAG: hypothetical protein ACU843_16910 [Gammaproteobacteria bacterium]